MLPIASNLPSAMFSPLVLLIVGYAVLALLSARANAHEDTARAERYGTIGFALVLVAALYVLVLAVASVVSYPSRVYDMVITLFVIGAFFALLLFIFFAIAEILPRRFGRGRAER
jgi:hypothetical protein